MEAELNVALREWTDMDVTCFRVAIALGIFPESVPFNKVRGLFFPAYPNANGERLLAIIEELVALGVLEYREDTSQYRWSPQFEGLQKVAE